MAARLPVPSPKMNPIPAMQREPRIVDSGRGAPATPAFTRTPQVGPFSGWAQSNDRGSHRYAIPFVGRQLELRSLLRALRDAEGRHGSTWAIVGPAGIGKTRLLRRLDALATERGFRVRWGYGLSEATAPLFSLLQLFDPPRTVRGQDGNPPPEAQHTFPEVVVEHVPGEPRSSRARPSVDHVLLRMMQALEEDAEERPQLVIVDDVDKSDAESLRGLYLLSRIAARIRAVIVVGSRSEGLGLRSDPTSYFADFGPLQRAGLLETIRLGPLSPEQGVELISSYLGTALEPLRKERAATDLVAESGGNPYFILEMVDAYRSEGRIRSTRTGWSIQACRAPAGRVSPDEIIVPESIRRLVVERIRALPPGDLLLILAGSHAGLEFAAQPVAASLQIPDSRVLSELRRLALLGWPIHTTDANRTRFAFEHGVLRDILREASEFPLDSPVLGRMAEWYRTHRPEEPLTEAELWAETRNLSEMSRAVSRAVDGAITSHASRRVPDLVRWLSSRVPDSDPAGRALDPWLFSVVAQLREQLDRESVEDVLLEWRRRGIPPVYQTVAELWRIESSIRTDPQAACRALDELEERLLRNSRSIEPETKWRIAYVRGVLATSVEDCRSACRTILEALKSLPKDEAPFEACRLYGFAIAALSVAVKFRTAEGLLKEARQLVQGRRLGHSPAGLALRTAEAVLEYSRGRGEIGYRILVRQVGLYGTCGGAEQEAATLLELAKIELGTRQIAACRQHVRAAIDLISKFDLRSQIPWANLFIGLLGILDNDYGPVARLLEESSRAAEYAPNSTYHAYVRILLAIARAETGNVEEALEDLTATGRRLDVDGLCYEPDFYRALARIFELKGDPIRSRSALLKSSAAARRCDAATDQAGSLAELEEWATRHGTPTERNRWRAKLLSHCRKAKLDPDRDWKGIGFPRTHPVREQVTREQDFRFETRRPAGVHLRNLILAYLAGVPVSGRARGGGQLDPITTTERGMAEALGIPRDRFARTLQRLLNEGRVQRSHSRLLGSRRSVYTYRAIRADSEAEGVALANLRPFPGASFVGLMDSQERGENRS